MVRLFNSARAYETYTDEFLSDERRPICSRCEQGKHECLGYIKPFVFLSQDFNIPTPSASQSSSSARSIPKKPPSRPFSHCSESEAAAADLTVLAFRAASTQCQAKICDSLPLNAFQSKMVISYLLECFSLRLPCNSAGDAPTMDVMVSSKYVSSSAYLAGLGLAEAFFGHMQKSSCLLTRSVETYGRALRHLRKDFETAGKWTSAQTFVALWACEFLALYELINPTSPCNWMDHGRGMGLLVSRKLLKPGFLFQSIFDN